LSVSCLYLRKKLSGEKQDSVFLRLRGEDFVKKTIILDKLKGRCKFTASGFSKQKEEKLIVKSIRSFKSEIL